MMAQTRSGLAGEAVTPIRPLRPLGRPGLLVISVQVSPPSVDLYSPLSGPPLVRLQKSRRTCHMAAYRRRGLLGSRDRSAAPASALFHSTCVQGFPPSVERNTPRCALEPNKCPRAATYTMSGLCGWIRMRAMWRVSASPRCVQVLPPSVDLYTPSP